MIRIAHQQRWSRRRSALKTARRFRAVRCEQLEERRVLTLDGIPLPGSPCTDFQLSILGLPIDIPDPGWTWVDPLNPIREAAGLVTNSKVSHTDFPSVHDSHDQTHDIEVDPEYLDLLSIANGLSEDIDYTSPTPPPTEIEVEWENGIAPSEKSGDGTAGLNGGPIFPKWAWPSPGDRASLLYISRLLFRRGASAGSEYVPGEGEVVHALQAEPDGLRAGWVLAMGIVYVAAELRD